LFLFVMFALPVTCLDACLRIMIKMLLTFVFKM
jgi:hypothetical protein